MVYICLSTERLLPDLKYLLLWLGSYHLIEDETTPLSSYGEFSARRKPCVFGCRR